MTRAPLLLVLAALLLGWPAPTWSQEREEILSYHADVVLQDGGAMRVTETLEVRALGQQIRRGIFRDFPTTFPRPDGVGAITAPFDVQEVRRDGAAEPYALEGISGAGGRGGTRIRIGRADVMLDPGVHTYEIVYETARWVHFGEERDALTWNVTGNGWDFPILSASASLTLPARPPVGSVELEAWTGPEGSRTQDAEWSWDGDARTARFQTTGPLAPRDGLTVRITVPSGVIPAPTEAQRAAWLRADWGGFIEAGVVVGLVLALYLVMWMKVGRDPPGRPIPVRYEPPDGFSAADLGYLRERGWAQRQLVAALVSLAVKGAVTLERSGSTWRIIATDRTLEEGLPADVTPDEKALYEKIIGSRKELSLTGGTNERLRAGVKELKTRLSRRHEKVYFLNNRRWFAAGAVLSILGFGWLAFQAAGPQSAVTLFLGVWLTFWTVGTGSLVWRALHSWKQAVSGNIGAGAAAAFLTLFSLPFVGAEIFVARQLYQLTPLHVVAAAVALGGINVLFYHLLERPTMKGRRVMDLLEGFRRFLGATEEDRFDRMQAPDRSLELFERFLPHAIALDVENAWAERFEGALAAASAVSTGSAAPSSAAYAHGALGWYSGPGGAAGGLSSMTSSLGSSFSSSLSSASAAPSSGGGGGGGGSSGGGGGGGGGGGW